MIEDLPPDPESLFRRLWQKGYPLGHNTVLLGLELLILSEVTATIALIKLFVPAVRGGTKSSLAFLLSFNRVPVDLFISPTPNPFFVATLQSYHDRKLPTIK